MIPSLIASGGTSVVPGTKLGDVYIEYDVILMNPQPVVSLTGLGFAQSLAGAPAFDPDSQVYTTKTDFPGYLAMGEKTWSSYGSPTVDSPSNQLLFNALGPEQVRLTGDNLVNLRALFPVPNNAYVELGSFYSQFSWVAPYIGDAFRLFRVIRDVTTGTEDVQPVDISNWTISLSPQTVETPSSLLVRVQEFVSRLTVANLPSVYTLTYFCVFLVGGFIADTVNLYGGWPQALPAWAGFFTTADLAPLIKGQLTASFPSFVRCIENNTKPKALRETSQKIKVLLQVEGNTAVGGASSTVSSEEGKVLKAGDKSSTNCTTSVAGKSRTLKQPDGLLRT